MSTGQTESTTTNSYFSNHDLEAQISHLSSDSGHVNRRYDDTKAYILNDQTPSHKLSANELVYSVTTSGSENEYIHLDDKKFLKSDMLKAFGDSLTPSHSQRTSHRKFGDPGPIGMCAFALTTFVISLINVEARGVTTPNVIVGLAFFYGGMTQLLAGMWELASGNTFGAVSLTSYGAYWLSFGAIYVDFFGIVSAYGDNQDELNNALGFYLIGWAIFTLGLTLLTKKCTIPFFGTFFTLEITFWLLAAGKLGPSTNCTKAGGYMGIICALFAWYCAFADLATEDNSYIQVRFIQLAMLDLFKKKE